MKFRTGFVTNSSSSSYVIAFNDENVGKIISDFLGSGDKISSKEEFMKYHGMNEEEIVEWGYEAEVNAIEKYGYIYSLSIDYGSEMLEETMARIARGGIEGIVLISDRN